MPALLLAAAMASGCKKAPPPAVGVDAAGFQAITERIDREVAAWVPLLQFDRSEDHVYVVIPVFEREGVLVVGQAEAIAHIRGSVTRESWRGPESAEDLLGGIDVHARERVAGVPREQLAERVETGFAAYAQAAKAGQVEQAVAALEQLIEVTTVDFWHGDAPLWVKRAALGDWVITVVRDDADGLGVRTGSKTVSMKAVVVRTVADDDGERPLVVMSQD